MKKIDLDYVNLLAIGMYRELPAFVGVINCVESKCDCWKLFLYPAREGRMVKASEKETGFVYVECRSDDTDLIGKDQYYNNFDHWAEDCCRIVCGFASEGV